MSTASSSGAAAHDGSHATVAAPSPSPPQDSCSAELAHARQELQQCQEKFALWKEKAKSGVDSLRAQIIELTQKLEQSTRRSSVALELSERAAAGAWARSDLFGDVCAVTAELFTDAVQARAMLATAATQQSAASSEAVVERLQRTIQDQADRLKETQHALRRSNNELQQRTAALQRQDEAAAALKRRLESVEAANTALEEQLMSVPNVEEWRAAQEELDHQLEQSRLEYENRESDLVLHHSNAIQQLNALHEEELRELQRDAQERIAQAVQNALASQTHASHEPSWPHVQATSSDAQCEEPRGGQRAAADASYMDLLQDYKALEFSASAAARERDEAVGQQKTLLRELQDLFRAIGTGSGLVAASGAASSSSHGSTTQALTTVEEAVRQMGEQRVRFVALQEELSRCRREVMQLKRSKPSTQQDGLGAQQTQYLRSVVVQLLCSLSDPIVAKRLLPVLSMLLKFSDDDLTAVTKAMPQWKHR